MSVPTLNPLITSRHAPAALRELPAWLCWRFEQIPGEVKQRKVPVYVDGSKRRGRQGSTEDRARLVTYDIAFDAAMKRGWGIGFCPMPEFGICALDFDNCVSGGQVHPEVDRLVAGTYAELSPSGRGVRAFVVGQLGNRKDAHGTPFGLEVFSSKGFVTVTGSVLPITKLTDAQDTVATASPELLQVCGERFQRDVSEPAEPAPTSDVPPIGLSLERLREALDVLPDDLPYEGSESWISVGMALHHETGGSDEGFELWDEWSQRSPKYTTTEYGRFKWDSFGRNGQKPTTAHRLVKMANEHGAHIDLTALAAADFEAVADEPVVGNPTTERAGKFTVEPLDAFASRPAPTWIVKGVLPKAELVVLFGESGAGKSFIALDIGAAIAQGVEWRGHRVRQGRVAYIAAEGAGGFRNRVNAYCIDRKVDPSSLPFGVISAAPNLLMKDDALEVCKAIKAWGGADVVIVDTFAQTTPGANENAAEDMGKALGHCKGIHRATGAVVVLVHHAGKDASRGARGWSGLKAAADAELEVLRTPGGRMLRTSKQKDGEDGLQWGFDLEQLPIGMDADGDVITSCVVREAELPAIQQVGAMKRKLGKWEQHVVAAINEIAQAQTSGIEIEAVISAAMEREPKPEGRDTRRQHARRALTALINEPDSPYDGDGDCISII